MIKNETRTSKKQNMCFRKDDDCMDNANKLRVLRHEAGLSQQQVADAIGVSKSTYFRLEKSTEYNSNMTVEILLKLLELYHITFENFNDIDFPIVKTEKFSPSLVRELESVVTDDFATLSPDWRENRDKLKELQTVLFKVMDERAKFFDFPELDLTSLTKMPITVKTVNLDVKVEKLLERAFKVQKMFSNAIF